MMKKINPYKRILLEYRISMLRHIQFGKLNPDEKKEAVDNLVSLMAIEKDILLNKYGRESGND